MANIGLIYDPIFLEHDTGKHVENSQRLVHTINLLQETGLIEKLLTVNPVEANVEQIASVHATQYIQQVERVCQNGGGNLDLDTVLSPQSYRAALKAAGAAITAVDMVMTKRIKHAFALVRPPGHHATCWHGMGFCVFNNIAIAAKHALLKYNLKKILIVDFDVHHGNGTQDTFYMDPSVLYFSTHQYPLYPGTGHINEIGGRDGEGFNVNVPLAPGCGDMEYQTVYEDILAPVAMRFRPELILVSAGYDAHWADNLASMKLSVWGFSRITEILKVLADNICEGKIVFTLEGGYNIEALAYSIAATLNILIGNKEIDDPLGRKSSSVNKSEFEKFVNLIKEKHAI